MNAPIYLDYNATTPLDPVVIEAMLPWLREGYGNPSSSHALGRAAHAAVERGRAELAGLLNAQPDEIVFTGGGSEASNHAIKGAFFARQTANLLTRLFRGGLGHVITSAIEHPATSEPIAFLKKLGCRVTVLPVDGVGRVDPDAVRQAIAPDTFLVSIMHSNNEVGTLQLINEIGSITRERGILLHTDVAQSLGKVPVDVQALQVDLLSVAGHKLYAPKGIGALYIRRGVTVDPLLHGAGHERGRRAGTENVPAIVALGTAARLARESLPAASIRLQQLRDRLHVTLQERLGERLTLNGCPQQRLPNTLNVNFAGQIGAELLNRTPEIAASTGSACHEGRVTQSAVLCAMGVPPERGKGAVRLSVGRFTTEAEVDTAGRLLSERCR
ncbi:MAG: cysteine desulfurase family protein [Gemmataceae bacterium]